MDMYAFIQRLKQPSTYAALAVGMAVFGVDVTPEFMEPFVGFAIAAAVLAGVFLDEGK